MSDSLRSRAGVAAGVVALMLATGVAVWAIGHHHANSPSVKFGPGIVVATPYQGTAYLGANRSLNTQPTGTAYSFGPNISWDDATGGRHEGGRPGCIRYFRAARVQRMEVVTYPLPDGVESAGTVVWVQC